MIIDDDTYPVLADDAVVVPTDDGLIMSDGFGTHIIGGPDLARFAEPLIGRLDGSSSMAGIAADTTTQRTHLRALVELLHKRGLVCLLGPGQSAKHHIHPLTPHRGALQTATVIVYTEQRWGQQVSQLLTAENVATVTTIDDVDDQPSARDGRLAALNDALRGRADLLLIALEHNAIDHHLAAAGLAIKHGVRHIFATLRGPEAIVGPYVVPGQTACWNCWRLREIACAPEPWAERIVHAHLHDRSSQRRATKLTQPPTAAASLAARAARLILGGLAGLGAPRPSHVYIENLVTCTTSSHNVMQMPDCQLCGGLSQPTSRGAAAGHTDDAQSDGPYREWLDSRVGVIQDIRIRRTPILPSLVRAYAVNSDYGNDADIRSECRPYTGFIDGCGGKGFTEQAAVTGALGEAIERYSASIGPHNSITATITELAAPAIPAHQLIHYSDAQYRTADFGYHPPEVEAPLAWVTAEWLDGSGQVWVPADLAYYRPGSRLAQITSNGLAAGLSYADAAARAILEAIERDAFLRTWATRSTPPRIDVHPEVLTQSLPLAELTSQMHRAGLIVEFYQLAAAGDVTAVLAVARADESPWPAATVATAAHIDPVIAVENAALELAYTILFLREVLESGHRRVPTRDSDVHTFLDHALRYSHTSSLPHLSFITNSTDSVTITRQTQAAGGDLAALQSRIPIPIALADVTSPDVAATGIRVVRALSPTLTPLWCGDGMHRVAHLAAPGRQLNTKPHPMC